MAVIDSKKLLPPSKSTGSALTTQKFLVPISNIKVKSSAIVRASDITPVENERVGGGKTLLGEFIQIRKNFVSIQKIIGDNNTLFKKSEERKRKLLEKEKFAKKEQQLEKKDPKQKTSLSIPSLPRTGFLDAIKRFLFYTLLGAAFVKFGKHIPKILEFSKKLLPAFKFVEDFAGNLLNGAVEFIDKGYKAYDKVRELTKQVGGEDFQKKFDEFSKQFNTFANLALIAGMSTMGGTDFRRPGGAAGVTAAGASGSLAKSTGGFGAGTGMTPGRYRLPGQAKAGSFALEQARKGLSFEQSVAARQASKQVATQGAKQSLKSLTAVPIIGALIGFIIDTVIFKEKPSRAAAGAVGSAIGQGIGIALAGGTTFGLGAGVGMFVGGFAGDWLGKALYDTLTGYNENPIQAKAQGGQVTRGGQRVSGPARRSIRRVRTRPPKIKPQKTIPGKDVGGKEEIKKIFPSPANPSQRNPLGVLETTSKNLKEVPLLGGIMGASVDLVMGQKPDASVFRRIGYGFGALVQNAIDAETSNTIGNIQKEIVGLAGGGAVPRTLSTGESIGMQIGERLGKTLEAMMNSKVTETLQSIRQQFGKEGFGLGPDGGPDGGPATQDQQEAFEKIRKIAERVGSPNPSVTAAIAMLETGWLSNPNSVYFASGKTNPFGQTGRGPKGSVVGADGQEHAVYNSLEEGVKAHVDRWKSSYIGKTPQEIIESIRTGRGAGAPGMYNVSPSWTSKVLSTYQSGTQPRISPASVSGNIKDTGIKDSSGRSIKLKGVIADAFIEMAAAARKDGIDLSGGISNALRDPEHNRRVGGAQGSRHLTGEAFDINWNSSAGKWIRNNASRFGFRYNPYSSQSTHFDWIGGYTPQSAKRPTPKPDTRPASTPPAQVRTKLTRSNQWDPSQSGLRFNPKTGKYEKASLAPSTSPNVASGLNQKTSYEVAGGNIFLQRIFIEKPVPMPMSSGAPVASIDNSRTTSSTAALSIG